jgi:hypothetical protein
MVLSGTIRSSGYMIMIMIMPNVLESYAAAVYSAAVYGSRMSNLLESGNIKINPGVITKKYFEVSYL